MSDWKRKRFWTSASAVPAGDGFEIRLDARSVQTPGSVPLVVPTQALADAIALEWDAQQGKVDPGTMPMTCMANTAIDKVSPQRAVIADLVAEYGGCDLLCYRAEGPEELCKRQGAAWDPLLVWAEATLEAPLGSRAGVMFFEQPDQSLKSLSGHVHKLTHWQLVAFHDLVALSGSLVIAFAVVNQVADPSDLWAVSRLDERWQAEQWGEDDQATEDAAVKARAFQDAARFFDLCQKA